ncbi:MAG: NAD-dependent epimerase/dehydratase family protein, partial [Ruminococcus sp.]|nr:NAD-dependent epimerase/dehydratase family protein [Ruminococcus sp.]
MTRNVFLTGAGGLLGTQLLHTLENTECSVTALTSKPDVLAEKFDVRYSYLDTADFLENGYDFSSTDVLIHCAFPRNNDGASMAKGLDFQRVVFESAVKGGINELINISSQSVYNPKRTEPADEQNPAVLETKYAAAKYMSEQLVEVICNASNVKYTNLRIASLIGIDFSPRIINRFVRSALEQGSINVNAGRQKFGFLDVRDMAEALKIIIFSNPDEWKCVYNVGADKEWGILQ